MLIELSFNQPPKYMPEGFSAVQPLLNAYLMEVPPMLVYWNPVIYGARGSLVPMFAELFMNLYESGCSDGVVLSEPRSETLTVRGFNHFSQEQLQARLANINSAKPRTSKGVDPEVGHPIGGAGIRSIRRYLAEYSGELLYTATSHSEIRAEMHIPGFNQNFLF